ncbi:MAG: hypothetical protein A2289_21715 [Deltaproteobacteria bacterium RIFOXYA12_FULL_58_15]|nr:MAG: hypothetical protein A2289_21715 [Deltaproteobacteria bacterium RIFOXYA12_FULL_58_15]OGR09531.1 MAG: hypothetical protein A2341_16590 [Deltaproteobacteria bacterium RIFOXYB12_FULL_58_9]
MVGKSKSRVTGLVDPSKAAFDSAFGSSVTQRKRVTKHKRVDTSVDYFDSVGVPGLDGRGHQVAPTTKEQKANSEQLVRVFVQRCSPDLSGPVEEGVPGRYFVQPPIDGEFPIPDGPAVRARLAGGGEDWAREFAAGNAADVMTAFVVCNEVKEMVERWVEHRIDWLDGDKLEVYPLVEKKPDKTFLNAAAGPDVHDLDGDGNVHEPILILERDTSLQDGAGRHPANARDPKIVAHETGHAILCGLMGHDTDRLIGSSKETVFLSDTIHEAVADVAAILHGLGQNEVLRAVMDETGGDMRKPNCASAVMETQAAYTDRLFRSRWPLDAETAEHLGKWVALERLPEHLGWFGRLLREELTSVDSTGRLSDKDVDALLAAIESGLPEFVEQQRGARLLDSPWLWGHARDNLGDNKDSYPYRETRDAIETALKRLGAGLTDESPSALQEKYDDFIRYFVTKEARQNGGGLPRRFDRLNHVDDVAPWITKTQPGEKDPHPASLPISSATYDVLVSLVEKGLNEGLDFFTVVATARDAVGRVFFRATERWARGVRDKADLTRSAFAAGLIEVAAELAPSSSGFWADSLRKRGILNCP